MLGIDYSQPAIDLARAIATKREADGMRFETVDLFDATQVDRLGEFDLILDKVRGSRKCDADRQGTFDAISLAPPDDGSEPLNARFAPIIARLLAPDGVFVITSCNFTIDELKAKLATPTSGLEYHAHVPRPTFSFGGHKGSTLATVAFRRARA